jgi:hypothetical protein
MKHTFYTLDTYTTSNTFDTTNRGVAIIDTSELTVYCGKTGIF